MLNGSGIQTSRRMLSGLVMRPIRGATCPTLKFEMSLGTGFANLVSHTGVFCGRSVCFREK